MPENISLCLERLDPADGHCYTRCVALPGYEPGLGVSPGGEIVWLDTDPPLTFELWVSADDKLILLRREGALPVHVIRAERSLSVPAAKPVVLLDQDEVQVEERCHYRIHLHGATGARHAPEGLEIPRPPRAGRTAAALALGAAAALASGCDVEVRDNPPAPVQKNPPVEVRETPPAPPMPPPPGDTSTETQDPTPPTEAGERPAEPTPPKTEDAPPVEVREQPPKPMPAPKEDD